MDMASGGVNLAALQNMIGKTVRSAVGPHQHPFPELANLIRDERTMKRAYDYWDLLRRQYPSASRLALIRKMRSWLKKDQKNQRKGITLVQDAEQLNDKRLYQRGGAKNLDTQSLLSRFSGSTLMPWQPRLDPIYSGADNTTGFYNTNFGQKVQEYNNKIQNLEAERDKLQFKADQRKSKIQGLKYDLDTRDDDIQKQTNAIALQEKLIDRLKEEIGKLVDEKKETMVPQSELEEPVEVRDAETATDFESSKGITGADIENFQNQRLIDNGSGDDDDDDDEEEEEDSEEIPSGGGGGGGDGGGDDGSIGNGDDDGNYSSKTSPLTPDLENRLLSKIDAIQSDIQELRRTSSPPNRVVEPLTDETQPELEPKPESLKTIAERKAQLVDQQKDNQINELQTLNLDNLAKAFEDFKTNSQEALKTILNSINLQEMKNQFWANTKNWQNYLKDHPEEAEKFRRQLIHEHLATQRRQADMLKEYSPLNSLTSRERRKLANERYQDDLKRLANAADSGATVLAKLSEKSSDDSVELPPNPKEKFSEEQTAQDLKNIQREKERDTAIENAHQAVREKAGKPYSDQLRETKQRARDQTQAAQDWALTRAKLGFFQNIIDSMNLSNPDLTSRMSRVQEQINKYIKAHPDIAQRIVPGKGTFAVNRPSNPAQDFKTIEKMFAQNPSLAASIIKLLKEYWQIR